MGLYDDSEFEAHRDAMQAAFHWGEYRRDYWCNYRQYYSGEFRRFIDGFTADRPCVG